MTAEAVFGYEMITFGQQSANKESEHAVMSALVRNAFDRWTLPDESLQDPRIRRTTTAAI
jgi:hypothetical protein